MRGSAQVAIYERKVSMSDITTACRVSAPTAAGRVPWRKLEACAVARIHGMRKLAWALRKLVSIARTRAPHRHDIQRS